MSRSRGNFQKINHRQQSEINRRMEWRSCKSKTAFSEFDAKAKAREFGQRAYLCGLCHRWHLTKEKYERR
jgi:hypothetical protein